MPSPACQCYMLRYSHLPLFSSTMFSRASEGRKPQTCISLCTWLVFSLSPPGYPRTPTDRDDAAQCILCTLWQDTTKWMWCCGYCILQLRIIRKLNLQSVSVSASEIGIEFTYRVPWFDFIAFKPFLDIMENEWMDGWIDGWRNGNLGRIGGILGTNRIYHRPPPYTTGGYMYVLVPIISLYHPSFVFMYCTKWLMEYVCMGVLDFWIHWLMGGLIDWLIDWLRLDYVGWIGLDWTYSIGINGIILGWDGIGSIGMDGVWYRLGVLHPSKKVVHPSGESNIPL